MGGCDFHTIGVAKTAQKKNYLDDWKRWHGSAPRGSRVFIFTGVASS